MRFFTSSCWEKEKSREPRAESLVPSSLCSCSCKYFHNIESLLGDNVSNGGFCEESKVQSHYGLSGSRQESICWPECRTRCEIAIFFHGSRFWGFSLLQTKPAWQPGRLERSRQIMLLTETLKTKCIESVLSDAARVELVKLRVDGKSSLSEIMERSESWADENRNWLTYRLSCRCFVNSGKGAIETSCEVSAREASLVAINVEFYSASWSLWTSWISAKLHLSRWNKNSSRSRNISEKLDHVNIIPSLLITTIKWSQTAKQNSNLPISLTSRLQLSYASIKNHSALVAESASKSCSSHNRDPTRFINDNSFRP